MHSRIPFFFSNCFIVLMWGKKSREMGPKLFIVVIIYCEWDYGGRLLPALNIPVMLECFTTICVCVCICIYIYITFESWKIDFFKRMSESRGLMQSNLEPTLIKDNLHQVKKKKAFAVIWTSAQLIKTSENQPRGWDWCVWKNSLSKGNLLSHWSQFAE